MNVCVSELMYLLVYILAYTRMDMYLYLCSWLLLLVSCLRIAIHCVCVSSCGCLSICVSI